MCEVERFPARVAERRGMWGRASDPRASSRAHWTEGEELRAVEECWMLAVCLKGRCRISAS